MATTVSWKGYTWDLTNGGVGLGPGYGIWSNANITGPDANQYLTFKITNPSGSQVVGCEMFNQTVMGYGTYTSVTEYLTAPSTWQKNIVWGAMFPVNDASSNPYIEFDAGETSKWDNDFSGTNMIDHYMWNTPPDPDTIIHADIQAATSDLITTNRLIWTAGDAKMDTFQGTGTGGTNLFSSHYTSNVPTPNGSQVDFNLWVYAGGGGQVNTVNGFNVILRDFTFSTGTSLTISIVQNLTITESKTLSRINRINVSDMLTTTESVSRVKLSFANKFDSMSIADTPTVTINTSAPTLSINVSEQLTTTESNTRTGQLGSISVSDVLTTTESKTVGRSVDISVTETLTTTESKTMLEFFSVVVSDYLDMWEGKISQTATDGSGGIILGGSGTNEVLAQTFISVGSLIYEVDLNIRKFVSPTDNVVATITSTLGGSSLGSLSIPGASLTTSDATYPFVFSSPISVTVGSTYNIELSRDGARDVTNFYGWKENVGTTVAYRQGLAKVKNSGTFTTVTNTSMVFTVVFELDPNVTLSIFINKSDTMLLTESPTLIIPNNPFLSVSVSETVNATENISRDISISLSVSNTLTTVEVVTVGDNGFSVFVDDTFGVSEDLQATSFIDVLITISAEDFLSITESQQVGDFHFTKSVGHQIPIGGRGSSPFGPSGSRGRSL